MAKFWVPAGSERPIGRWEEFFRDDMGLCAEPGWLGINYPFMQWLHWSNLVFTTAILAAFFILALVIVGYVKAVGWVTGVYRRVLCYLSGGLAPSAFLWYHYDVRMSAPKVMSRR